MAGLRECTIVALAQGDWRSQRMLAQQIVSRLPEPTVQVIYGTGPMSTWERGTEQWQRARWFGHFENTENLCIFHSGRLLLRIPRLPWLDSLAVAHYARSVRSRARYEKRLVCYAMHPSYLDVVAALRPYRIVYHARDNWAAYPSVSDETIAQQEELVRRADLVIAASTEIARHLPGDGPRRAVVVDNGADVAAFEQGPTMREPDDLAAIPHPRIGYSGSVNLKVDLQLVAAIARRRPDWHWVFVGQIMADILEKLPDEDPQRHAWLACKAMPNVHILGPRPYEDIPAYVGHMDVNVMCYRTEGGWWVMGYPLKLHEYLAAGTPVIGSDIATLRPFRSVVDIPDSEDEWVTAIERSLQGEGTGSPAARRAVARGNSWHARVAQIKDALSRVLEP